MRFLLRSNSSVSLDLLCPPLEQPPHTCEFYATVSSCSAACLRLTKRRRAISLTAGIVLFELLTRCSLWHSGADSNLEQAEDYKALAEWDENAARARAERVPDRLALQLLLWLLQADPKRRPRDMRAVLRHPFFTAGKAFEAKPLGRAERHHLFLSHFQANAGPRCAESPVDPTAAPRLLGRSESVRSSVARDFCCFTLAMTLRLLQVYGYQTAGRGGGAWRARVV